MCALIKSFYRSLCNCLGPMHLLGEGFITVNNSLYMAKRVRVCERFTAFSLEELYPVHMLYNCLLIFFSFVELAMGTASILISLCTGPKPFFRSRSWDISWEMVRGAWNALSWMQTWEQTGYRHIDNIMLFGDMIHDPLYPSSSDPPICKKGYK